MIKELVAVNYGCLKEVSAKLTPLHAFIGPNDSGKSTLLHGIRTVVQFAGASFEPNLAKRTLHPFEPWLAGRQSHTQSDVDDLLNQRLGCAVKGGWYRLETEGHNLSESIGASEDIQEEPLYRDARSYDTISGFIGSSGSKLRADCAPIMKQLSRARLVRFEPDTLRKPSGLIPRGEAVGFLSEQGAGLPGVYQAILAQGDDSFSEIRKSVRQHFPTIKRIGVPALAADRLGIEVELDDGTLVPASRMSEGLLYYLAFAALRYLAPANVILVEEPENGLHPSRIADVVRTLRAIVEETGTQIVMATHSPLVINELRPEEVTVVTRPSAEAGTQLTPIAETPDFDKRSQVYALGELWLSYANGSDEGPLLRGSGR